MSCNLDHETSKETKVQNQSAKVRPQPVEKHPEDAQVRTFQEGGQYEQRESGGR